MLAFTCVWFGMLVPVHQRGQIQLPGGRVAKAAEPRACHGKCGKTKQPAAPASRENCAVCHFILGLHAPPPVTIYVERLGLLESRPAELIASIPLRHAALPFHGLDPPSA
jgi:hypothetical protein